MYIYTCIYGWTHVWAQWPMYVHVVNAEYLSQSPSCFLRQGFSPNLELSDWLVWLAIKLQEPSHFCLPNARMFHPTFCGVAGDLNSSLHTCPANTLLSHLSWPCFSILIVCYWGKGSLNWLYLKSHCKCVHLLVPGNFLIIYNNVLGNIKS